MGKLQKVIEILQTASAPPPEVAFIEQLLDAPDNPSLEKMLESNGAMVNDAFMEALNGLVAQVDAQANQGNNPEAKKLSERMENVYKAALKFSMKKKIQ